MIEDRRAQMCHCRERSPIALTRGNSLGTDNIPADTGEHGCNVPTSRSPFVITVRKNCSGFFQCGFLLSFRWEPLTTRPRPTELHCNMRLRPRACSLSPSIIHYPPRLTPPSSASPPPQHIGSPSSDRGSNYHDGAEEDDRPPSTRGE